jgi:hypothetical protein
VHRLLLVTSFEQMLEEYMSQLFVTDKLFILRTDTLYFTHSKLTFPVAVYNGVIFWFIVVILPKVVKKMRNRIATVSYIPLFKSNMKYIRGTSKSDQPIFIKLNIFKNEISISVTLTTSRCFFRKGYVRNFVWL